MRYNEPSKTARVTDTYQQVTNYVIEALEKGVAVWRKPWGNNSIGRVAYPQNLTTQKPYKGWNHFYLDWVVHTFNFPDPYFVTFKQVQTLGGTIKKGSTGFPIVKWVTKSKDQIKPNPETGREEIVVDVSFRPVTHVVFNVEQTEGLTYSRPATIERQPVERLAFCEGIVKGMCNPPVIIERGDRACYSRHLDIILMPELQVFDNSECYYDTLFHEMVHSTGHEKRLNRPELLKHDGFGGDNYSKEELTAEMGAAYLCGITGIGQKTIDNSAAYLQSWLKRLRDDKTLLFSAASRAQAAADYILGKQTPADHS